ncbi:prepilin-type N-terminal cleavage/methylation domain-containing protein [Halochromatium sp.]
MTIEEAPRMKTGPSIRGFSLVEALIAAVILGVGLIGLAKLQTIIMGSSGLSQQRNEAAQIAQDKIEYYRGYSSLPTTPGQLAYADIVDSTSTETLTGVNTRYSRSWTTVECCFDNTGAPICPAASCASMMRFKQLAVTVAWTDKTNEEHSVVLRTIIGKLDPNLDAGLVSSP